MHGIEEVQIQFRVAAILSGYYSRVQTPQRNTTQSFLVHKTSAKGIRRRKTCDGLAVPLSKFCKCVPRRWNPRTGVVDVFKTASEGVDVGFDAGTTMMYDLCNGFSDMRTRLRQQNR